MVTETMLELSSAWILQASREIGDTVLVMLIVFLGVAWDPVVLCTVIDNL